MWTDGKCQGHKDIVREVSSTWKGTPINNFFTSAKECKDPEQLCVVTDYYGGKTAHTGNYTLGFRDQTIPSNYFCYFESVVAKDMALKFHKGALKESTSIFTMRNISADKNVSYVDKDFYFDEAEQFAYELVESDKQDAFHRGVYNSELMP